jgi:hypothetical protein
VIAFRTTQSNRRAESGLQLAQSCIRSRPGGAGAKVARTAGAAGRELGSVQHLFSVQRPHICRRDVCIGSNRAFSDCEGLHNQDPSGVAVLSRTGTCEGTTRRLCNGARFVRTASSTLRPRSSHPPQPARRRTPAPPRVRRPLNTASSESCTSLPPHRTPAHTPLLRASWTQRARPTCALPVRLTSKTRRSELRRESDNV